MFSAKALYNNISETPDELSFSKGDVLEVVEEDANGWWLCSFKGKVGIAPGNRLQPLPLSTMTKSTSSSGRNSPSHTQTLMHAEKFPSVSNTYLSKKRALDLHAKPSWHSSGKVVVPKKQGNVYVYDISNHAHQDYDVLPSSFRRIFDTLPSYDVPSALRSPVETNSDPINNYDTLPALIRNKSQPSEIPNSSAAYDIPPTHPASGFDLDPTLLSSRLSTLSVLSAGSHSSACSGHSSMSGSMSTHTNVDVSVQDIDDVLPCSRLDAGSNFHSVTEQGLLSKSNDGIKTPIKHCMQSSTASSCVKKETAGQSSAGPPSNLKLHVDRDSYLEDYSVPRSDISQSSGDSGISVSHVDSFCSHSFGEIYDTPKKLTDARLQGSCNIQNSEESKYDILPHQMNETLDGKGLSDERVGADSCAEISGCLQVADSMNTLIALQSNVLCHGSNLIDLISKGYLGNHQQELPQIKLTCLALKSAIKEAIESGNVLLSQITNPSCKELSDRISKLLEKVHIQSRYLNRHADRLIMTQWTAKVLDCGGEISELDDNLNTIEMLTEYISARLLALTRFIMHNSSLLNSETPKVSFCDCANSDVVKTLSDESIYKTPLPLNEGTKKARSDFTEKQSLMQNRPLPPIPVPKSTLQESRYSKHCASKSAIQGMNLAVSSNTSLQRNNLSEWNDECDYVSIANEAESEMRAQEKLLGQQSPIKSASDLCTEAKAPVKITAEGNTVFGLMAENTSSRLEQTNEFKNIHELSNSSHLSNDERVESASTVSASPPDQRLMPYYMEQIETNISTVDTAVREFFRMMFNDHVTAKEFLSSSKFVILAAHKLVYIGDTITRNSACSLASQNDVAHKANRLCNLLKETVAVTKTSALNFPQSIAQQKLMECMKAVLQGSHLLCEAIRLNSS